MTRSWSRGGRRGGRGGGSRYAPLLEAHRDKLKATVAWNIEEGLRLTEREIARAEALRTELFHRARAFFERYPASFARQIRYMSHTMAGLATPVITQRFGSSHIAKGTPSSGSRRGGPRTQRG